jgi:L-methionine (R)-S-oxide reductase
MDSLATNSTVKSKKSARYKRIFSQLQALLTKTDNPLARMSTINAVLHHKMENFFWTGFYMIVDGELIVGPYQGPLACQVLEKNKGVCWACINSGIPVIVKNVNEFPGHIACDSRSVSEICIPVKNKNEKIIGVLDVDSRKEGNFDETDAEHLQRIVELINKK